MNAYHLPVAALLIGHYLLGVVAEWLNLRHLTTELPTEFKGYYDPEKYRRSQEYLRDNARLELLTDTFRTAIVLGFMFLGGFAFLDRTVRSLGLGPVGSGLVFCGILLLGMRLLMLPFSIYHTFVIEERYGFNKTSLGTFVLDFLKSVLLMVLIGGGTLAVLFWIFERAGAAAWLYCWAAMIAFQTVLVWLAPYVIMPLFNKFLPLPPGELRTALENYAREQHFHFRDLFTMDGSRRSTKTNAFFTGFGRSRRVVLFDTLIERHSVPELVAIVAHEAGHWKKHHVPFALLRSAFFSGLTFYLFALFLKRGASFLNAFQIEQTSVYASLVIFSIIYGPQATAVGIIENAISRAHEYEADAFAVATCETPEALAEALKKLSVENLSNLTPHPLKVLLDYSHPPVLARLRRLTTRKPTV